MLMKSTRRRIDEPSMQGRLAYFVDRLLRGAKPADLPVEDPTRFEFVINLAAARAIGINVPAALRIRATRLIE